MKRYKLLIFSTSLMLSALACSLTGTADVPLDAGDAALVETGVAEVLSAQDAAAEDLDVQEGSATATQTVPTQEVQQPPTETSPPALQQPPTNTPPPSPTPIPEVWDGVWDTYCYYGPGCDQVILEQTGEHVVGTYRNGDGEIEGTAVGNHLVGIWKAGGEIGTIDFWLTNGGNKWRGNYNGSYFWCGGRQGELAPRPCGVATFYGTWDMPCIGDDCLMVVTQDGRNVSGTYPNGGTFEGTVTGNQLDGTWERENYSGTLTFWMMAGGKSWQGNADTVQPWCGFRDIDNANISDCGIVSWFGTWVSQCGNSGCGEIILNQDGKSVTGTYADGEGDIEATVDGTELTGTWSRNGTSGAFHFFLKNNGYQFSGNYNNNFPWCGYLEGTDPPAVCLQQ